MGNDPKKSGEPSEAEIAKRRDETLRRMHKMPPKPHSEIKGKRRKQPKGKKLGKAIAKKGMAHT
jgi:hypothetical protein